MKFGLMFTNTGFGSYGSGAVDLATAAEEAGFESLWAVEHIVVPSGYQSAYPYDPSGKMAGGAEDFDLPDPLIWLAYVAAVTTRIRLATGILILPERNPVIAAKEVATVDHLSGGRVVLGVGVGWLEEEFRALGVPFAKRGKRLDAYIDAMRALWTQDKASVSSEFVDFTDCISRPRPANGTVPIVIGGHTEAAARRAGRIGDGFFPGSGDLDGLRKLFPVVKAEAEKAGRDPDSVELTGGAMGGRDADATARRIDELAALGVTRVVIGAAKPNRLADIAGGLRDRFGMDT
jgi:probable F420-dependent oxidoreductase